MPPWSPVGSQHWKISRQRVSARTLAASASGTIACPAAAPAAPPPEPDWPAAPVPAVPAPELPPFPFESSALFPQAAAVATSPSAHSRQLIVRSPTASCVPSRDGGDPYGSCTRPERKLATSLSQRPPHAVGDVAEIFQGPCRELVPADGKRARVVRPQFMNDVAHVDGPAAQGRRAPTTRR